MKKKKQIECRQSEAADQTGNWPSLFSVFAVGSVGRGEHKLFSG